MLDTSGVTESKTLSLEMISQLLVSSFYTEITQNHTNKRHHQAPLVLLCFKMMSNSFQPRLDLHHHFVLHAQQQFWWNLTSAFHTESSLVTPLLVTSQIYGADDTSGIPARADSTIHEAWETLIQTTWSAVDSRLWNRCPSLWKRASPAVFPA